MFNSKKEFVQAMMEGRVFEYNDKRMYFEPGHYSNPFRWTNGVGVVDFEMGVEWSWYDKVVEIIEAKWYDNIPKNGVLCWVWNEDIKDREIAIIHKYSDDDVGRPFISFSDDDWNYAEPMSKKEVMKYIL